MLLAAVAPPRLAHAGALVDVELLIAADVSISMDKEERRLQQAGFVAAFRDPDVLTAIRSGPTGRIAVAYVEWGGTGRHRLVVPWTVIEDAQSAGRFANRLERNRPATLNRGTSIGSALSKAHALFGASAVSGARRIVNISGDGVDGNAAHLAWVRDALLADGITINGLPIVYKDLLDGVISGRPAGHDPRILIDYFERQVIGGPHAFVEPVTDIGNYAAAIRRKLLREIGMPMYAAMEIEPGAP